MASFTSIGSPEQILENEPVNDIKIINVVIERVALVEDSTIDMLPNR